MSRNPYLAATRPSSYTRSSRSSKRPEFGSKTSALSRSRSSTGLGSSYSSLASSNNSYSSAAGYVPSKSNWYQPSSHNNRSTYHDHQRSSPHSSFEANDGQPSSRLSSSYSSQQQQVREPQQSPRSESLSRVSSFHNLGNQSSIDNDQSCSYLENYQRSKLQNPSSTKTGSLPTSIDSEGVRSSSSTSDLSSKRSLISNKKAESIDTSQSTQFDDEQEPRQDANDINNNNSTRLYKHGQLVKSNSLDIGKQILANTGASTLFNSISVDRLLIRSESMTERELRKIFKELVIEYERLKDQIRTNDDNDKQSEQDWIRKERQLQRKISELEEENRQLEEYKLEIQRLKDENSSLIRVVSKLTKQN